MYNRKHWMLPMAIIAFLMIILGLSLPSAAFAQSKETQALDIAILIDASGSTRAPSGVDVNGNGEVGRKLGFSLLRLFFARRPQQVIGSITDPGDSILAAEALASKRLIAKLDSRTTRVAIISFTGDYLPGTGYKGNQTFLPNPDTPDAVVEQPLTHDFHLATDILGRIEQIVPDGGTNFAEGIRVAISELRILHGSISEPRPDAQKVILFLTDGIPTFPEGSASTSDPEDKKLAISAAELAGRIGITIHAFGLGKNALKEPETLKKVAEITGGRFTPLEKAGDIIEVLPAFDLTSPGS